MREALVSIFGEDGALVIQYIITFVVILALAAAAVWLYRRFSGGAVNVAGRGRLPRLAVIDALTVDKRRRLVLVRRDNVEHLLLIGGPSDIVVEPAITRTRVAQRPGQAPGRPAATQPAANAPQPAPPPPPSLQRTAAQAALRARAIRTADRAATPGREEPIPFPPRRPQTRQPERLRPHEEPKAVAPASSLRPAVEPEPDPAPPPAPAPKRIAAAAPPPERPPVEARRSEAPGLPAIPPFLTEGQLESTEEAPLMPAEVAEEPRKSAFAPPGDADHPASRTDRPQAESPAPAAEEPRRPPPVVPEREDDEDTDTVGNLEKDMARLLGQISTGR